MQAFEAKQTSRKDTKTGCYSLHFPAPALDEALSKLASLDERKARLVELRFFAGLGEQEAAEALGVSRSTASEDWRYARAWLSAAVRQA